MKDRRNCSAWLAPRARGAGSGQAADTGEPTAASGQQLVQAAGGDTNGEGRFTLISIF